MKFRFKLIYFIVQKLRVSNKEAQALIQNSFVKINNQIVLENSVITEFDEIRVKEVIIQKGKKPMYIAYYKPRGIECTLNETIENNLKTALAINEKLFPLGRLDKESEGLLILTNDGSIYNKLLNKNIPTEKKYLVQVNKEITKELAQALENGIIIMGKQTLPSKVNTIDSVTFEITLIEGLNRQIRRMCYKYNYEVISLKRISFADCVLSELKPGEWKAIKKEDISPKL